MLMMDYAVDHHDFMQSFLSSKQNIRLAARKLETLFSQGSGYLKNMTMPFGLAKENIVKEINPISIGKDRKVTPHDAVTEGERQSLRALIGSLQYAAINTRPDLASRLGWLQSNINKATVATLLEANKTLHEAKMFADVTVKIQPIPLDHLRFVAFSDASFASEKVPDSHQGMMIMSCHKDIGDNKSSVVNPIVWHSKKIQKVVVSTLSAEAMSLAGAVGHFVLDQVFLGMAARRKMPMAAGR